MSYLTDSGKNDAAGGIAATITHLTLHSDYPGTTQANELSGGSPAYARKTVSWNSAASGAVTQNGSAVFDVPGGGTEVRWIGLSTGSSGGTGKGAIPIGGQTPKEYTVNTSTDVFTSAGHGYADGDKIVFVNGTVPTGLTAGTIYFVRDSTTDTFKVAATAGGSAIDITGAGGANAVVCKIIPETYANQGTLTVSSLQINFNML